jgi:hypothetical protein
VSSPVVDGRARLPSTARPIPSADTARYRQLPSGQRDRLAGDIGRLKAGVDVERFVKGGATGLSG